VVVSYVKKTAGFSTASACLLYANNTRLNLSSILLNWSCFINFRSLDRLESSMLVSAGFADDYP